MAFNVHRAREEESLPGEKRLPVPRGMLLVVGLATAGWIFVGGLIAAVVILAD
jgi:hypothetical protein